MSYLDFGEFLDSGVSKIPAKAICEVIHHVETGIKKKYHAAKTITRQCFTPFIYIYILKLLVIIIILYFGIDY